MPTFDSLPAELRTKIFEFCPLRRKLRCRTVSRSWHSVLSPMIEKVLNRKHPPNICNIYSIQRMLGGQIRAEFDTFELNCNWDDVFIPRFKADQFEEKLTKFTDLYGQSETAKMLIYPYKGLRNSMLGKTLHFIEGNGRRNTG